MTASSTHPPAFRSAEEIGRTISGPRPLPDLGPSVSTHDPELLHADLPNGLHVIAVRKARSPLVELRLRIPFGGRTRKHAAKSELLAATVLLGSGSRTREQVDADLARVGGHLDANVDPQRLVITGSALATGLPTMLDVLADCLVDPAYTRHDVRGERERLMQHLVIAASQPSTIAHRALQARRFGDHPAAWDIPEAELVGEVGRGGVRKLHAAAVVPAGSTLVLVGDLEPEATVDVAAQALSGWSAAGTEARLLSPPPEVTGDDLAAHHREAAVQSQVRLSAAGVPRSQSGYPAAQLANLIYGGYFSSRLVENIREDKGYTYHARSAFEFWPGTAAVTVSFDTTTPSTAAALLEARYELGRISVLPPTDQEVEAARNYALGTLATSLATQAGLASMLSMLAGVGLDDVWLREHPRRLAAVTVDEVAEAAATLLAPSGFTGVVIGDLAVLEPGLRALGGVQFADSEPGESPAARDGEVSSGKGDHTAGN